MTVIVEGTLPREYGLALHEMISAFSRASYTQHLVGSHPYVLYQLVRYDESVTAITIWCFICVHYEQGIFYRDAHAKDDFTIFLVGSKLMDSECASRNATLSV